MYILHSYYTKNVNYFEVCIKRFYGDIAAKIPFLNSDIRLNANLFEHKHLCNNYFFKMITTHVLKKKNENDFTRILKV